MVAELLNRYIDQSLVYCKMYFKCHFLCEVISDPPLLWLGKLSPSFLCSCSYNRYSVILFSSGYTSSCPSLRSLRASWKQRWCLIYTWVVKHLAQCYMFIELNCTNYLQCPYLEGKKKANLKLKFHPVPFKNSRDFRKKQQMCQITFSRY